MSMIASFYIVSDSKCEGIIQAAIDQGNALTKKRFGFFPPKLPLKIDPFWEFMNNEANELEKLPYSGALILDLEMIINGLLKSSDPVGQRLCEITDSSFITYKKKDASIVLEKLNGLKIDDEQVKQHLEEEGRLDDYPDIIPPLNDCISTLKNWFLSVEEEQTGILNIG